MFTYIILLITLIIINFLCKNNKKRNYIITSIYLLLLAYLKCSTLGDSDTLTIYLPRFNILKNLSFTNALSWIGEQELQPFFYILTKVFTIFSVDYKLYVTLCITPLIFSFGYIVYKYSQNPLLSYIIFWSFFYPWSWIILKHSMAWGILIIVYELLRRDKIKLAVISIVIATLFHPSAAIFLCIIPLRNVKSEKNKNTIILISIIASIFGYAIVSKIIFSFINTGHYTMYDGKNSMFGIAGMLLYIVLYYFCVLLTAKSTKTQERFSLDFSMIWIGTILVFLSNVVWDIFRMGMYFNIIYCVLIPNVICNLKNDKTKKIITFCVGIIICLYGIKTFSTLNLLPIKFGG